MIKRVLWTALIVFVILLIIFWLVTGGWGAVARTARSLMNPFDFFMAAERLRADAEPHDFERIGTGIGN